MIEQQIIEEGLATSIPNNVQRKVREQNISDVTKFVKGVLNEYAEERKTGVRNVQDLSPLEIYLLQRLYKTDGIWRRAMKQVQRWRFFKQN